jgi:hypothetical protein
MWHVDEGTLHAYLDDRDRGPAAGALDAGLRERVVQHLSECDICAASLRLAERQRARAADVLLAATPVIETPPFEAVQPIVGTTPIRPIPFPLPRRTGPRRAWMPLAWAASLMLAVGAGWMASLMWQGGEVQRAAPEQPASTASSAADRADAGAPASPAASDVVPAPAAGAPRMAEGAARPAGEGSELRRAEAPRQETNEEVAHADRLAPVAALSEQAAGKRVADTGAENRAVTAERQRQLVPRDPARDAVVIGGAMARVNAAAAAAAPQQVLAESPALGFAARSAEGGYPGDADVVWKTVSREEAERLLGAPLYLLAGAPIDEIAAAPQASPALVRVRQRANEGRIELVQWRAATGQAVGADVEKGVVDAAAQKAVAEAARETRSQVVAPPAAPPSPVVQPRLGRARDGGSVLSIPATTHPVMLKAPLGINPALLIARIRQEG